MPATPPVARQKPSPRPLAPTPCPLTSPRSQRFLERPFFWLFGPAETGALSVRHDTRSPSAPQPPWQPRLPPQGTRAPSHGSPIPRLTADPPRARRRAPPRSRRARRTRTADRSSPESALHPAHPLPGNRRAPPNRGTLYRRSTTRPTKSTALLTSHKRDTKAHQSLPFPASQSAALLDAALSLSERAQHYARRARAAARNPAPPRTATPNPSPALDAAARTSPLRVARPRAGPTPA